jgi:hypothetical protein
MRIAFPLALAAAAAFVWWSGGGLPPVVASHFAAGGAADGFMERGAYIALMLALVVGVPALIHALARLAARLPVRFVNVPNRAYWLAPERRAATLASLRTFGLWASYATLALLCAVHWLVVRANSGHPAHLEQTPLVGVVAVYLVGLFIGMAAVLGRFLRAP